MNGPAPVIARVHFLDPRTKKPIKKSAYALIVAEEGGMGRVTDRVCIDTNLKVVVAFARKCRVARRWGRIRFEPPDGVDEEKGGPRRYEALTVHEIFYASSALGQS